MFEEKRERMAWLTRQASTLLAEHPDTMPQETADKVEEYLGERDGILKEIQLREKVASAHQDDNEPQAPRSTAVKLVGGIPDGKGGFESVDDLYRSVYIVGKGGRRDSRLRVPTIGQGWDQKDLEEGTGSAGGFLVPTEYSTQLITIAGEGAIVRPRATLWPMGRRQLNVPSLDYVTGGGEHKTAFYAGVRMQWTEESAPKPETEPKFKQLQLVVHKLAGLTYVEDELSEDSAIPIGTILTSLFGGAMRWEEDFAFLQGDGVGKPLGILNANATIAVPRAGAGAVTYVDIVNMLTQLLPGANPVWVYGSTVLPQLLQLQDPAGHYIFIVGDATKKMPDSLMGYPAIRTEKLPALGATGDILLADFKYYYIGDRKAITIAYSEHYRFPYDETTWRVEERIDGQPCLSDPIPLQDGNTVSPFVILGPAS
jgi:HK97 family phage major capsid protein